MKRPLLTLAAAVLLMGFGATLPAAQAEAQAAPPAPARATADGAAADSIVAAFRARYGVPALAAVVVRSDSTLAVVATGVRRRDRLAAVSREDLFHLGSNAKAITATVIARLVEEGRLAWTTRPVDLFPELAASIHPAYRDRTIEQLLRHRGGTPPYTAPRSLPLAARQSGAVGTPAEQRRAFTLWLLRRPAHVAPGTEFVYSNAGYAVAGAMAEAAAGESWESLVETRLARPLGIHPRHGWPARGDDAQPWGHRMRSFLGLLAYGARPHDPAEGGEVGPIFDPAGDLALSPGDYGRFLRMHLAGLQGRDGLLRASTIRHLHSGPGVYGLGWGLQQFDGTPAHVHTGSAGSFIAKVALLPERDLAVAVITNAGSPRAERAAWEATAALLRAYGGSGGR